MLRYEHIEYLNFLFGIPVLILAMLLYSRWKANALTLFGESKLVKELMHSFSKRRTQIKNMFTLLIFIATHYWNCQPASRYKNGRSKKRGCGFNDSH